jgi:hypothetical protein
MNLILFISITEIKYPLRRIKFGNTVVFHKLAALRSSVVPHERTNATTETVVDVLYNCKLIVATFLFVTLGFSFITMPKATYSWKGKIVTKITKEKRLAHQKSGEKRRKTALTWL